MKTNTAFLVIFPRHRHRSAPEKTGTERVRDRGKITRNAVFLAINKKSQPHFLFRVVNLVQGCVIVTIMQSFNNDLHYFSNCQFYFLGRISTSTSKINFFKDYNSDINDEVLLLKRNFYFKKKSYSSELFSNFLQEFRIFVVMPKL